MEKRYKVESKSKDNKTYFCAICTEDKLEYYKNIAKEDEIRYYRKYPLTGSKRIYF